jgi:hypothetical protein
VLRFTVSAKFCVIDLAVLKDLSLIAAAIFLRTSGAIAQVSSGEDRDAGQMHCFAVLVMAGSEAKKPEQKLFEKPEILETVAKCNASRDWCPQTVKQIKEKQWPMPAGLSCGG